MTKKEILQLQSGEFVMHKQFGKCRVVELYFAMNGLFGIIVVPRNFDGATKLMRQSGTPLGTPLIETSYRNIIKKTTF